MSKQKQEINFCTQHVLNLCFACFYEKIHTVSKYSFLITKQLTSLYVAKAFRTLPFAYKGLEKNILIHRLGRLKRESYICSAVHYKESTRRKLIGRLMMLSYIIKSIKFYSWKFNFVSFQLTIQGRK